MDHEVVPRPSKIYDWLLNLSRDYFNLHQENNVRETMEFEVSKRHILRLTLSTNMVQWILQWERQKRCYGRKWQGHMAKKCCHNKILMRLLLRKRRWRQENTREWSNLNVSSPSFKSALFRHILKHISAFIFWCMVIPLGPHLVYT